MRKALKFTIETQTEDLSIVSICHINEKLISLQTSEIAKKMFEVNRGLFEKIDSTTNIVSGQITRYVSTKRSNNFNTLKTKMVGSGFKKSYDIFKLNFINNSIVNSKKVLLPNGREAYHFPESTSKTYNYLNYDELSEDDLKLSKEISSVEEVFLFQDLGIRTLVFTDNLDRSISNSEISYEIQIESNDSFHDHIKFVNKKIDESIYFLSSYLSEISSFKQYDYTKMSYNENYLDNLYGSMGMDSDSLIDFGSPVFKNSSFGQCAISFYNGLALVSNDINKNIYGETIKRIFPSPLSSPSTISNVIKEFASLRSKIRSLYDLDKYKKVRKNSANVKNGHVRFKKFLTDSTESYKIEDYGIGYNIFSEKQTGLGKLSVDNYRKRVSSEMSRYCPSINIEDSSGFMTQKEKSSFSDTNNSPSFLTPLNLLYNNKKISTSRGLKNIDPKAIKEFRVAKASAYIQSVSSNLPSAMSSKGLYYDTLSKFNISVSKPGISILSRKVDEDIDPNIDSRYYVGESSFFLSSTPSNPRDVALRQKKQQVRDELSILYSLGPNILLSKSGDVQSIKDLRVSDPSSRIRSLVKNKSIDIENIPPQIKSMMSKGFQTNANIDPLKNSESREILEETQKNIFVIKAITGFEKDEDGLLDLNKPIIEEMSKTSGNGPMLAKAYNYEVPELGIVKDKFLPTIYNNLLYLR